MSGPGESDGSPPDSDGSSKPPTKKVKSRSRVWQKVTRLTKKGRPVKGQIGRSSNSSKKVSRSKIKLLVQAVHQQGSASKRSNW